MRTRVRWLSASVAAAVTVGVVVAVLTAPHAVRRGERSVATSPPATSTASRARTVLRIWDRHRAAAWSRGDLEALADLYLPGSATGRRDRAMLTAYRRHGLRVTDMTRQVLGLRVASAARRRLTLVVTDRLVDARVVGPGVRSAVPDGHPFTRRVSLVRAGGRWRVAEVVVAGQPAR